LAARSFGSSPNWLPYVDSLRNRLASDACREMAAAI
jgi:hypothetical protein